MTRPLISVVVFARNAGATIGRALESVCGKPIEQTEVIVLDGGSSDGTLDVIQKYRGRLAYLHSGPDGGPTNAINEGIRRARGEVICLLPGDDWLEPDALALVAQEFGQHRDIDVLSCGARIVRLEDGDRQMHVWAQYCDEAHLAFTLPNILRNPLTCARFVKKRVYEKLGGMDNSWTFPDKEFLVRAYLAKVTSRVQSRLVYNFRRHIGSATNSGRSDMTIKMLEENLKLARHYANAPEISAGDRAALRQLHAGSSARLAVMLGVRGRLSDAGATVVTAFRSNPIWPLNALAWYYGSAQEKLRNARER